MQVIACQVLTFKQFLDVAKMSLLLLKMKVKTEKIPMITLLSSFSIYIAPVK